MRLLFLHAFPLDRSMWDAQCSIAPNRTIRPTLYRFGASMEAWARHVLRSVGPESIVVVGASMGGSCALEIARQAPAQVAALVLVGAKAGHRPEPALRDHFIGVLRSGGVDGLWPTLETQCFGPAAPAGAVERVRTIGRAQDPEDLINAMRVFHGRPDASDVVARWRKPLLVINGGHDGLVGVRKAAGLARLAPHGQLRVMRAAGHYVNLECPDEFNDVLTAFLSHCEQGAVAAAPPIGREGPPR